MPKVSGVNHRRAVNAFRKCGFNVVREGRKHIIMSNGIDDIVIPRNNPVNAYTLGAIVKDSGLSVEEFKGKL
ncbi:MAG: type II toxin-antitoxin system HicA family toxin [Candidatus Dadabacteria bacterium]|nr:type II toxin-antitoxin system HicA family toxin [Candidatus Dadabacteria bacterium]